MLFQNKKFKGSRIISTLTSYVGGSSGGKKKKSSDKSDSLQVIRQGNKLRIAEKVSQTQRAISDSATKKSTSTICELTAAKLACNSEWNISNVSTARLSLPPAVISAPKSPGVVRNRSSPKKPTSPIFTRGYNSHSQWDHPAFRSSLYIGPNYLKSQKSKTFGRINTNERIFSNLDFPLQSIQECEEELLY